MYDTQNITFRLLHSICYLQRDNFFVYVHPMFKCNIVYAVV